MLTIPEATFRTRETRAGAVLPFNIGTSRQEPPRGDLGVEPNRDTPPRLPEPGEESGPLRTAADTALERRTCRASVASKPLSDESSAVDDEPGDLTLVGRLRAGDMDALGDVFARHHRCILITARQLVDPITAEDMASEAVERLAAAVRRGGGPTSNVCGYLQRTVRTCVIDHLRKRRELLERHLDDHPAPFDSPDQSVDRIICDEVLAQLPARWRFALLMTYTVGLERTELGTCLGLAPQAATQMLYRARAGARAALAEKGIDSLER